MAVAEWFAVPSLWLLTKSLFIGFIPLYFITVICNALYNVFLHPLRKYPGPTLRAAFQLPDMLSLLRGTAYKDTKALHDKYGSVVRLAPNTLSYNSSQAWKDIYGLKPDRSELDKHPAYYKRSSRNLLVVNQADHTRMRKLIAHAFSDTALLEQSPILTKYFDLLVERLKQQIDGPEKGRLNIAAWFNFTTFDIIGDMTLGEPFGALKTETILHGCGANVFSAIKFLGVIRFAETYLIVGLLLLLLQKSMPSLAKKRAAHLEYTKKMIDARLARETDRNDFMTYILRHNDERGMSYQELVGTCRVFLVAGSETTATLLSGAIFYLLQNPSCMDKLKREVREAFPTANDITMRSVTSSGRLSYMEAVLQESFRCYPPVPSTLPRITGSGGAIIDGKFVPPGTSVGVNQWSAYRSSSNFASPNTFDPGRWLPDAPGKYRGDNKAVLQPFTLGPRQCIGKGLAYFELRSILSRMMWHFEIELDTDSRGWLDNPREFALWDKPPLWVRLRHRTD
ncbi:cytochrome P450, putative [Talaromyces stipitatus ATCC 10500]|uniref:Cytochrome P450, putative n=1 Tax=Talaromyces stipitatus (strain ATCC 10500 / CBS 375.48 / QM 6759 / NRRL 1006) TaxID=441959 RepID=B8LXY3_TALSN|nr:cytochrome P450, putative [Talaromyces stipitatus ATCC 10500]EED22798.1 cytochrome P450, putative [Talaromyces stipitatus ATCC 10500]